VCATVPFRISKKDVVHQGVKCLPTASSAAHTQGTGLRHLPFLERLVANIHLLSISAEEQETAQRCILDRTIWPTGVHQRRGRCPLWVKSEHLQCKTACPLWANSRHHVMPRFALVLAIKSMRLFAFTAHKLLRSNNSDTAEFALLNEFNKANVGFVESVMSHGGSSLPGLLAQPLVHR
jgi:hypothetical protein